MLQWKQTGKSKERDRLLLSLGREVLCLHNRDGIILHITGAVHDVIGVEPDEVIGRRLDDFIHIGDRLTALERWGRLSAGIIVPISEFRLVRPDGEVVWVEVEFSAIPQEAGDASVFGSSIRNVTRRRVAEADLRQVRDDLSSSIAAGQGTLYRLVRRADKHWRPVFFAANIERITDYTVAQAMEMSWPDGILSLPNRAMRQAALNRAAEDGMATAEYDLPRRGGQTIRVRDHLRRWDRSDGAKELVGYLVDITDAHEALVKLRRAQEEIAAVVAAGAGMMYRALVSSAEDGHVVFASGNIENVTGFTVDEVQIDNWFRQQIDPKARTTVWNGVRQAVKDGTATVEFRFRHKNGGWRWGRDTIRFLGEVGQHLELVGYLVDITEEKERTTQLAQASKLATLGEMATGMAHELSQPLASISMAAENAALSLQNTPTNIAVIAQKLERISEQAIRAAKLIDHMRIFGRRDGGETRPVSLALALEGALTIVTGRLRATKTIVKADVEPDLPDVRGSIVLVEQVLINLIANACDAYAGARPPIDPQNRVIDITIRHVDLTVVAMIADHAGGINDTDLARIFEPFFTTKPPGEGTGLGLSISYGVVTDMGGSMTAYNNNGGAVFEIRLPKYVEESIGVESERAFT